MKKYGLCMEMLLIVMLSLLAVTNCWAITVAIYGAEYESGLANITTALVATGLLTTDDITAYDVQSFTPSVGDMLAYDAVLIYSNYPFYNRYELGDNLADYVDAGGGVVVATFGSTEGAPGSGYDLSVQGRLATSSYMPWSYGISDGTQQSLGTYNASHAIMAGVSILNTWYWDRVSKYPAAKLVASWGNNVPCVAYNHEGQVVGVGFYPNGEYSSITGGDYAKLLANALLFAANPPASIKGRLTLSGFTGDVSSVAVRIELIVGDTVVRTETTILSSAGDYTVSEVAPGTYKVAFKAGSFLRKVESNVTVAATGVTTKNVTLSNGDSDGDNGVTTTDLSILIRSLGQTGN